MGQKPSKPVAIAIAIPIAIPVPVLPEAAPDHVSLVLAPEAAMPVTPPLSDSWDILKAIVYGGLVESVMSLTVVSAAASSGAKTLNIFILGIANLIGGLPIILYNMPDLRNLGDFHGSNDDEQSGHYWLQFGRRSKFRLHMVMAIVLSYLLAGLLPPAVYLLSSRRGDGELNREKKMMAAAGVSLTGIALLAIGKAHVKTPAMPRSYVKSVMYYLSIGVAASGLSLVAGVLITMLLDLFGITGQPLSLLQLLQRLPGLHTEVTRNI